MKPYFILFILLIFSFSFGQKFSQEEITNLKTELKHILDSDQELRELIDSETTSSRKNEIYNKYGLTEEQFKRESWFILNKQDSINFQKIEKIIQKFGYPGKSMVGEPENTAVWYVIQHSEKIEKHFPLIKSAGEKNEIPKTLVAMMEDRLLVQQGKEQIYGTQGNGLQTKKGWVSFIWPIKNPEKVNELRKQIGFTSTVEENAKRLGIEYKTLTLEDVKKFKEK